MAKASRKSTRKSASPKEDFHVPEDLPWYLLRGIGSVTADWSALEYMITDLTWRLAGVSPALGACITTQIFTFNGHLDALIALLQIRQADKALIADLNRFASNSRGPQEIRNRAVHDVWTVSQQTRALLRLEIKAKGTLAFDLVTGARDEAKQDELTIRKFVLSFVPLHNRILAALPTLPEIPVQSLELVTPSPPQNPASS